MTRDHEEVTVIVSNPVQLGCEVSGNPVPEITWRRGPEDITYNEGFYKLPNGALRIESVSVEDTGMYECLAMSSAGSASKTVMLTVQGESLPILWSRCVYKFTGRTENKYSINILLQHHWFNLFQTRNK